MFPSATTLDDMRQQAAAVVSLCANCHRRLGLLDLAGAA